MSAKREIRSYWWEPDQPDIRWPGDLTLQHGCLPALQVSVERTNLCDDLHPMGRVLQGIDADGRPITLLFVTSSGDSVRAAAVTRSFHAGYALIGIALSDAASLVVNEFYVKLQQLHGWLGISGFRNEGWVAGEFAIHYRQPKQLVFKIKPDLEISVGTGCRSNRSSKKQSLEEEAYVSFRSKAGLSLNQCRRFLSSFRMLLNLASTEPVYPTRLIGFKNDHGLRINGQWIREEIEIWTPILREPESEHRLPGRWVFRFEDVRARFAAFVRKWLWYTVKFSEALGCYFATVFHELPPTLVHLSITQALEAYHGVKFQSHKQRGLQGKLTKLLMLHSGSLNGIVNDVKEFAKQAAETRHYYAHHNPEDLARGRVSSGAELLQLNERLKLLFQVCVLTDLGIPSDRFNRLREQLATEIVEFY